MGSAGFSPLGTSHPTGVKVRRAKGLVGPRVFLLMLPGCFLHTGPRPLTAQGQVHASTARPPGASDCQERDSGKHSSPLLSKPCFGARQWGGEPASMAYGAGGEFPL